MSEIDKNNLENSPSLLRLQESPLVPKDQAEDKFKSILDKIFGIQISERTNLEEGLLSPEQILLIQNRINSDFENYKDLKPVSIFKTSDFDEDGNVTYQNFLEWCSNYLTYDEEIEVALAQHKVSLYNLSKQQDKEEQQLKELADHLSQDGSPVQSEQNKNSRGGINLNSYVETSEFGSHGQIGGNSTNQESTQKPPDDNEDPKEEESENVFRPGQGSKIITKKTTKIVKSTNVMNSNQFDNSFKNIKVTNKVENENKETREDNQASQAQDGSKKDQTSQKSIRKTVFVYDPENPRTPDNNRTPINLTDSERSLPQIQNGANYSFHPQMYMVANHIQSTHYNPLHNEQEKAHLKQMARHMQRNHQNDQNIRVMAEFVQNRNNSANPNFQHIEQSAFFGEMNPNIPIMAQHIQAQGSSNSTGDNPHIESLAQHIQLRGTQENQPYESSSPS